MEEKDMRKVVNEFFGDTTRSQQETKDALESLKEDIETMIEALENDIKGKPEDPDGV